MCVCVYTSATVCNMQLLVSVCVCLCCFSEKIINACTSVLYKHCYYNHLLLIIGAMASFPFLSFALTLDEFEYFLILILSLSISDEVNLVL